MWSGDCDRNGTEEGGHYSRDLYTHQRPMLSAKIKFVRILKEDEVSVRKGSLLRVDSE